MTYKRFYEFNGYDADTTAQYEASGYHMVSPGVPCRVEADGTGVVVTFRNYDEFIAHAYAWQGGRGGSN